MDAGGNSGTIPTWQEMLVSEMLCPICLRWMAASHSCVPCGHIFCSDCLLRWLMHSPTCPCCRSRALAPVPCLKIDVLADMLAPHFLSSEERIDRDERLAGSGRSSSAFQARWRDILSPGSGTAAGHSQRPGHGEEAAEIVVTPSNLLGFIVPPALEGWSFRLALPAPEPLPASTADSGDPPSNPGPTLLFVREQGPQLEARRPLLALPAPGPFISGRILLPSSTSWISQPSQQMVGAGNRSFGPQDTNGELPHENSASHRHPREDGELLPTASGEVGVPGLVHSHLRTVLPLGPNTPSGWLPELENLWLNSEGPPLQDAVTRPLQAEAFVEMHGHQSNSWSNQVMAAPWQALRHEPGPSRVAGHSPPSLQSDASPSTSSHSQSGESSAPSEAVSRAAWRGDSSEEEALINSAEVLAEAAESPVALEADVALAARGFAEALAAAFASSGEALDLNVRSAALSPRSQEMGAEQLQSSVTTVGGIPLPLSRSTDDGMHNTSSGHSVPPITASSHVPDPSLHPAPEVPVQAEMAYHPFTERTFNSSASELSFSVPHFPVAANSTAFPFFPVLAGNGGELEGGVFQSLEVAPGAIQLIPVTQVSSVGVRWRSYLAHEIEPSSGGQAGAAEQLPRHGDVRASDRDNLLPSRHAIDLDRHEVRVNHVTPAPSHEPGHHAEDSFVQIVDGHIICLCPACLARLNRQNSVEGSSQHIPVVQIVLAPRQPRYRLRLRNALLALLPVWAALAFEIGVPVAGRLLFPSTSSGTDMPYMPAGWEVALLGP